MYTIYNPNTEADESVLRQGLTVSVKRKAGNAVLRVIELPTLPLAKMKSTADEFTPGRIITNFELVDANDQYTVVTDFTDPIEIRIPYTQDDVDRLLKAAATYTLSRDAAISQDAVAAEPEATVGYWNGKKWVRFTEETHALRWVPAIPSSLNPKPATAILTVTEWIDPAIGAGPP